MLRATTLLFLLAGLLFVLTFSSTAFAQTLQLFGTETYSQWAGTGAVESIQVLQAPGLLQAFEMGERGDDPCYFKATFAEPTGPGTSRAVTRELDLCARGGPTRRSLESAGAYTPLASPTGVTDLRICRSRTGDKVKALVMDVGVITFNAEGVAQRPGLQTEHEIAVERRNCGRTVRRWTANVSCPDVDYEQPQYAVGLRVGIIDDDVITDFQLICRQVREAQPTIAVTTVVGSNGAATSPPSSGVFGTPSVTIMPNGNGIGGITGTTTPSAGSSAAVPMWTTYGRPDAQGLAGDAAETLTEMGGRANEMLYAMEFGERSNEPCYLKTFWMDASRGRDDVRTRTETFDACNGSASSKEYLGMATSAVESASGNLLAIRVIAVKTNLRRGTKRKLKATRIEYALPGVMSTSYAGNDSFSRANARGSYLNSRCDGRDFVVALEIHHNTVGSRQAITGLKAVCKSVRKRNR